jgi:carbamoyl-phosphate synthase large subunit
VAKATGVPFAGIAARVMVGRSLVELDATEEIIPSGRFVKESVFPFARFPGEDPVLGPEMRSTGEVMGSASGFGLAFAKAQLGAGTRIPLSGQAFISVNRNDRIGGVAIARQLSELGFSLIATRGTAEHLRQAGLDCRDVYKVLEGRPNVVDLMKNDEIDLIINTPLGSASHSDEAAMRREATQRGISLVTTLSGGHAMVEAIRAMRAGEMDVRCLQEIYESARQRRELNARSSNA